jgi:tRNA(Ile)-lysidine synthase TilS/MesJ
MGQHLDDMAESFLMSLFHNGRLRTMKANYAVKEADLRVIRPFAYVREKELRNFAERQVMTCPMAFNK